MVARHDTYLLYYLRFQKCDLQPDLECSVNLHMS